MQDDWEKKHTQKSSGKVYLPRYFGSQTTHSQGLISSLISRHSTGLRHRGREEENPWGVHTIYTNHPGGNRVHKHKAITELLRGGRTTRYKVYPTQLNGPLKKSRKFASLQITAHIFWIFPNGKERKIWFSNQTFQFSMSQWKVFPVTYRNTDLEGVKQRWMRRQQERQKSILLIYIARQQLYSCIILLCTFVYWPCTTKSTWNFLIPRFNRTWTKDDENTFLELRYNLLEFNSNFRKIR